MSPAKPKKTATTKDAVKPSPAKARAAARAAELEVLRFEIESAWERRAMLTPEEIEGATKPAVDRAIMRIAVWEHFNAVDVPPAVVVDEAVELAKELSTDESPTYLNGVLGKVASLAPAWVISCASLTAPASEVTSRSAPVSAHRSREPSVRG